jgi:cell wall-associated NlpC family hydrolase
MNCRAAGISFRRPATIGGICATAAAALLACALLAPTAQAEPAVGHQPALLPMDDHGFLGTVAGGMADVADRSNELLHEVRDRASGLVDSAINFLGVRYRRGGNSAESGFDCSGFTRYVFENSIGRVLPHRADEQANAPDLVKVDKRDLKPGDLVFFDTVRRTFSHVGIYLGDGKFIHSPKPGKAVRIEDMNIAYWASRFTGARRVPELSAAGNVTAVALARATSAAPATPGLGSALGPASVGAVPALSIDDGLGAGVLELSSPGVPGFTPRHVPLAAPLEDR